MLVTIKNKRLAKNRQTLVCLLRTKCCLLLCVSFVGKTIAAVDRALTFGLEGHFRLLAAVGAGRRKVLTGTAGSCLAAVAAGLAPLRLVLESTLSVKLLLTGRK